MWAGSDMRHVTIKLMRDDLPRASLVLAEIDASSPVELGPMLKTIAERIRESASVVLQMLLPRPAPSLRTRTTACVLRA